MNVAVLIRFAVIGCVVCCCLTAVCGQEQSEAQPQRTVHQLIDDFGAQAIVRITDHGFMPVVRDPHNMLAIVKSDASLEYYIDQLPDPLIGSALSAVNQLQNHRELTNSIRLHCVVLLYRSGKPSGWSVEQIRNSGAAQIILATARDEAWRVSLEDCLRTHQGPEGFVLAMLNWEKSEGLSIIRRSYRETPSRSDIALALALAGDRSFQGAFHAQLDDDSGPDTNHLRFAAALAALNDERGIHYLTAQLDNSAPPFPAWRLHVVDAMGMSGYRGFADRLVELIRHIEQGELAKREGESQASLLNNCMDALVHTNPERALQLIESTREHGTSMSAKVWQRASVSLFGHLPPASRAKLRKVIGDKDYASIDEMYRLPFVPRQFLPTESRDWAPDSFDIMLPRLAEQRNRTHPT